MKMTKEVVDKRRKKIMQEIQVKGTVNVDELATELNVTPLTIRRDLQYWEDMGAVERFYGGAKLVQNFVEHDIDPNEAYKHAIAKYAVQIVMTGGELRFPKETMTGDFALNNLQRVKANKAFLGCNGFDSEVGMSTAILPEVIINEAMISRCSGAAFILADATKINYVHQFVVAKPDSFAYLVTDTRVPAEQIEEFEEKGILVKQLDPLLNYKK